MLDNVLAQRKDKQYRSNPPIRQLKYEEVVKTVNIFWRNMGGWGNVAQPKGADRQKHIDARDWRNPKRTVQEQWNAKVANSKHILSIVPWHGKHEEYYAYEVNDTPVGMMVLNNFSQPLYVHIELLTAHPGSENCGGSLIEQAVNRSVTAGKGGRVSLESIPDAHKAYEAMGFKISSWPVMTLDPTKSDKWRQDDQGQWKLKSNFDKKYLWTALDSDDAPH